MKRFLLLLTVIILVSCNSGKREINSLKDSVTEEFLNYNDSTGIFDTADISYKILKAYVNNDESFFRDLRYRQHEARRFAAMDTCIHQVRLQDLDADEAYRFIYTGVFLKTTINITVTKKANVANLHFIRFESAWISGKCHVISEYDKSISNNDWKKIANAMNRLDFFGLKVDNGIEVMDGGNLTVIGYNSIGTFLNEHPKFNYVSRRSFLDISLNDPFNIVLDLCDNPIKFY